MSKQKLGPSIQMKKFFYKPLLGVSGGVNPTPDGGARLS